MWISSTYGDALAWQMILEIYLPVSFCLHIYIMYNK